MTLKCVSSQRISIISVAGTPGINARFDCLSFVAFFSPETHHFSLQTKTNANTASSSVAVVLQRTRKSAKSCVEFTFLSARTSTRIELSSSPLLHIHVPTADNGLEHFVRPIAEKEPQCGTKRSIWSHLILWKNILWVNCWSVVEFWWSGENGSIRLTEIWLDSLPLVDLRTEEYCDFRRNSSERFHLSPQRILGRVRNQPWFGAESTEQRSSISEKCCQSRNDLELLFRSCLMDLIHAIIPFNQLHQEDPFLDRSKQSIWRKMKSKN